MTANAWDYRLDAYLFKGADRLRHVSGIVAFFMENSPPRA
jgi:hypothetical protein